MMVKTFKSFLLIFIYSLPIVSNAEVLNKINTPQRVSGGILNIIVKESEGAYIPNARIEIVGMNFYRRFRSSESGELLVNLPDGWFKFSVGINGFYSTVRPLFKINSGDKIAFEVMMLPEVIVEPIEGKKSDPLSVMVDYLSEKIRLLPTTNHTFGLIEYGERIVSKTAKSKILYCGFTHRFLYESGKNGRYFPAVLMSNLYTISAKKITLERKSGIVVAEGEVTFHDGHDGLAARTLKSLVIDLKREKILKEEK